MNIAPEGLLYASTQYLFSTVRVELVSPIGSGSGTAFFFAQDQKRAYLVTNKHVIQGSDSSRICFHLSDAKERHRFELGETLWVDVETSSGIWHDHPDPEVDLCAARVSDLVSLSADLKRLYYLPIHASAIPPPQEQARYPAILEVAMVGYPTGLWDDANNLPVLRTWHDGISSGN